MSDPWSTTPEKHKVLAGPREAVWSLEHRLEEWLLGWNTSHIPDLTGKVALVTGGNSGLGYYTCKKLAENCAKVYLVARDRKKAEDAAAKIRSEIGPMCGKIEPLECDLMSLANVERLVHDFKARGDPLHILIANAGIFLPGPYKRTQDGFEQQLQVDYYSQVWLIMGLLQELINSAPSRVVWLTSPAERFGTLDWDNLKGDKFKDSGIVPYGCAKLWMCMWSEELQRRRRARGGRAALVDLFAAHPGIAATPLMDKADSGRYWAAWLITLYGAILANPVWRGALPILYAATEPSLQGKGFQIFGPTFFNLFVLQRYKPLNRAWRRSGPEVFRRLFDETERVLRESGHPLPVTVPPAEAAPAGGAEAQKHKAAAEPAGESVTVG